MKLFCKLKLKGINSEKDFNANFSRFNQILNLDDLVFIIPYSYEGEDFFPVHLDFDEVDGHFKDDVYVVRFKGLADTWNELNLEDSNIEKDDITLELLKSGTLGNYVLSFTKDNGELFTDIEVIEICYLDEFDNLKNLSIDKDAKNEVLDF